LPAGKGRGGHRRSRSGQTRHSRSNGPGNRTGDQFQREAAEIAVRHLHGVVSVQNSIRIKPRVAAENIKHRIEDAFRRIAEVDAKHITVDADGSEVTLRGEVRSWTERDHAQQTAWSAPGVTHVNNALTVRT
jgi:osmotically-inducible protein OsmY